MPTHTSGDIAGRTVSFETGRYAFQATGSATITLGETVLLATATIADTPREGCDFFPLTVDFEEKYYATGKIKGSRFIKREGRPSEQAILRCRLADRSLRPMFPKAMTNDVQIIISTLSVDEEDTDVGALGINAASAALAMAGAPLKGLVGAVRVGRVNGEIVINPTREQERNGDMAITCAGTSEAITMVEAGMKEVDEEVVLEALEKAHAEIKNIVALQKELAEKAGATAFEKVVLATVDDSADALVAEAVTADELAGVSGIDKKQVKKAVAPLEEKVLAAAEEKIEAGELSKGEVAYALQNAIDASMRRNILEKDTRIDGRGLSDIRPLSVEVGVLPRTHGTGLFQRGETQILSVATLAGPGLSQIIDTMDTDETRRYMHHYNFPPYSTGEAKPLRGTSRREIGHGDLAERALLPVLPSEESFGYTMRVVSETLSCNGSSSMASVCGSTLALMDAGVPIARPVAGIAMGLVTDKKEDGTFSTYKILSDIQGLEDFAGDMDFKVTGTEEGITALQMDIKVAGVTTAILREALSQAKEGRGTILSAMKEAISAPRESMSKHAPLLETFSIDPESIGTVIGKGGETIQKITKECGVEIDIEDDGRVTITAPDQEAGKKAKKWVDDLLYVPSIGDEFDGKVVRLMEFGAFIEFMPGKDGMLHISAVDTERVERIEDKLSVGDAVKVRINDVDDRGRINLSRVLEDGTVLTPTPRRENPRGGKRPFSGPPKGKRPF